MGGVVGRGGSRPKVRDTQKGTKTSDEGEMDQTDRQTDRQAGRQTDKQTQEKVNHRIAHLDKERGCASLWVDSHEHSFALASIAQLHLDR